jgi:hypothetical protein
MQASIVNSHAYKGLGKHITTNGLPLVFTDCRGVFPALGIREKVRGKDFVAIIRRITTAHYAHAVPN